MVYQGFEEPTPSFLERVQNDQFSRSERHQVNVRRSYPHGRKQNQFSPARMVS